MPIDLRMPLPERYQWMVAWVRRVVTQPRHELTRWQRAARFAYDLGVHGAKQLRQDRALQMAAALSFHTLFGLLPVLVVCTVVARAVMPQAEFLDMAHRAVGGLGLHTIDITPAAEQATDRPQPQVSLGDWIEGMIEQAMTLNLAAMGWISFVVLIYTAIALVVTVENSFNTIYRAPEGRSWLRRIPIYWFILTMSPVAMALTIYINNQFASLIESFPVWHWVLVTARTMWSLAITWLVMFGVYSLIPNTAVVLRCAATGALVAAMLLEILKQGLGVYFDNAVSFSQLYGSLGLIPLFMFWVVLIWTAILFGLEVAATLQILHGRPLEEIEKRPPPTTLVDPASVISVVETMASRFARGLATCPRDIAEQINVLEQNVISVLDRLEQAGIVHRLERPEGSFTLARPPDQIDAQKLLEVGFSLADAGGRPKQGGVIDRLRAAQMRVASGITVAALLDAQQRPAPGG